MTLQEFSKTSFGKGDTVIYDSSEYLIASVDFKESLIGLLMNTSGGELGDITWVRCENIEYKPYNF